MYYIQEIKYMFTVIIILSTTLYSRHVFFYLLTFVHVFACDRLKSSTRFQTLISKINITRFVFCLFFCCCCCWIFFKELVKKTKDGCLKYKLLLLHKNNNNNNDNK